MLPASLALVAVRGVFSGDRADPGGPLAHYARYWPGGALSTKQNLLVKPLMGSMQLSLHIRRVNRHFACDQNKSVYCNTIVTQIEQKVGQKYV